MDGRPAFIPALQRAGLALARGLGRVGVPVVGVGWGEGEVGFNSRYLQQRYLLTDAYPEGDARLLQILGEMSHNTRPILFPESDWSLEFVMRHWDEVCSMADLPLPAESGAIESLKRKDRLPDTAKAAGVPAPSTALAASDDAVRIAGLTPPLIVKPVEGKWFEAAFSRKGFLATDLDEAVAGARHAREHGFETIVQELIPDAQVRMYSLFTYIGRNGRPLASVVGRKERQLPLDFGSAAVFRVDWQPEVHELGLRLLGSCGYRGFAHVEFALDPRDSVFKLIEVNPRVPQWVSLGIRKDFNIARIAYDDLTGSPPGEEQRLTDPVVWVDLRKDLARAVRTGRLRPGEFAAPYFSRHKSHAVFAADDLRPALAWTRAVTPGHGFKP